MWDRLPIPQNKILRMKYKLISTNSEWKQGFAFQTKGLILFENEDPIKKGWAAIWEHESPHEDFFLCKSKNGLLDIKNVWDTGNGVVESWSNGAAMWLEEISKGRRYHCNDGHQDDDFDDIIFEIVVQGEE